MNDTIAAISTALGVGAISIIRISGPEAISVANQIFKGPDLTKVNSHTIHYGHIVDHDEIIDEVLVSVMKSPKTFTTEDVVEINCHGGVATTSKVLELVLSSGARLARPGEFSERAFLNGRIDLIKAEGIMEVINAKSDVSRKLAVNQLSGKVSNMIHNLRKKMVEVIANIEVNIDYPEYDDIEVLTNEKILPKIEEIKEEIERILKESNTGKLIQEGIKTAIIGRPNVGKSSLLNELLEKDKAIVTEVEGTTRDTVEGMLFIDGIAFQIIDTAGIRKTNDIVEKIGVQKSKDLILNSDFVLFVLNNNEPFNEEEQMILETLKNRNYLIIINKTDLPNQLDYQILPQDHIVFMSTKNHSGMDELKKKIREIFELEKLETKDFTYLTNARSLSILKEALNSLKEVLEGIQNDMPIDMVEIDIKKVWSLLGEIIGETYQEELIDQLFSQFCLGK